jgi:hypothetical protein
MRFDCIVMPALVALVASTCVLGLRQTNNG